MLPLPYCGTPPIPGAVLWNFDPVLISLLALGGLCSAAWMRRREAPLTRRCAFLAGWLILSAALVSPLCNLSVALFSARIGQHMLIEFLAAPLIAYGLLWKAPKPKGIASALVGAGFFTAVLWFWHMPAPYEWTFRSEWAYWAMHSSLLAAAIALSMCILDDRKPIASLLATAITSLQMTVLGAVYTFAGHALFSVHFGTTEVWGLTPLEDQQLGGLLMWIPPGVALAGVTVWTMAAMLSAQERKGLRADLNLAQD